MNQLSDTSDVEEKYQATETVKSSLDELEKKSTILGMVLMLLSGLFFSFVACLYHWGGELGYSSMQLLIFRGIVQASLAVLFGFVSFDYDFKFSYNYNYNSTKSNIKQHEENCNIDSIELQLTQDKNTPKNTVQTHVQDIASINTNDNRSKCRVSCKSKQLCQHLGEISCQLWFLVILRGIMGGLCSVFYVHSLTLIALGDSVTVFSLYPILTSFTASLFLNEKISCKHFISLIMSIVGVILIAQPSFIFDNITNTNPNTRKNSDNMIVGYVSGLLAALTAGISFVVIRKAKQVHHLVLVFSHGIVSTIIATILIVCINFETFTLNGLFVGDININAWIALMGNGIIGYLGQWTLSRSVQLIPAGLSSLLRSSDIIWSYIWQILFFNTIPSVLTGTGATVVVAAILVVSLEKMKAIRQKQTNNIHVQKVATRKKNNVKGFKLHGGSNKIKYTSLHANDSMMSLSGNTDQPDDIDAQ